MTRSASKRDLIRSLGATPAVADALDPEQVADAVAKADPEVIVHQLTSLTEINFRKLAQSFELTNRLRTEGTDHLLAAARAVGAKRFVAQSFAGWPYAKEGGPVKTEEDPLDPTPIASFQTTIEAIRYLEDKVTGADWIEGLVLRYGGFYGPGTSLSIDPPGEQSELVAKRRFPIVGDGSGIWSLIRIEDAATATAIAVERGKPGLYNVVDDDPAPIREVLPVLARALGAKPPRRFPRWLGRLAGGEAAVSMMTEARGASNEKAKRELDWQPRYPSWRDGFAANGNAGR